MTKRNLGKISRRGTGLESIKAGASAAAISG